MRISTDVTERDNEPAVNWVSGLIGAAVDKRVLTLEQSEQKNPFLITSHFRDNFPLEYALSKARKYKKNTGRLPKGNEFDLLYGFLIPAQRIYAELPQTAKRRFEGALRGALNDANGPRPFATKLALLPTLWGESGTLNLQTSVERLDTIFWPVKTTSRLKLSVRQLPEIRAERFIDRRYIGLRI